MADLDDPAEDFDPHGLRAFYLFPPQAKPHVRPCRARLVVLIVVVVAAVACGGVAWYHIH